AIPIGSALGYLMGGEINHRFGWRWAFFVAGAPGFLLALGVLGPRGPPRRALRGPGGRARAAPPPRAPPGSMRELLRRGSFVANTVTQIIYTFSIGGLAFWMPTYFQRVRHLELVSADRWFGGVLAAAGLVGTLIGGWFGDRMAQRHPAGHFTL